MSLTVPLEFSVSLLLTLVKLIFGQDIGLMIVKFSIKIYGDEYFQEIFQCCLPNYNKFCKKKEKKSFAILDEKLSLQALNHLK